jgi:catechol 2,3-dioxygenase-like lactoylglutathione lyase family enzyme
MPVSGLDHVNIRTLDVAASVKFYVDLFDFEYTQGPGIMGQKANWLYDTAGKPIIHFRVAATESSSTGPLDHVALRCHGKGEILQRLQQQGIEHKIADHLVPGLTQVFLKDPHGVALELNFSGE